MSKMPLCPECGSEVYIGGDNIHEASGQCDCGWQYDSVEVYR